MTPEQRLALLDDLKAQEHRTVNRARIGAWASVVLAACVTASMLYVSYRELRRVETEVNARRADLKEVNDELKRSREQLDVSRTKLRAWQTVTSEISKPELEAGFARASKSDPSVENILPRVYIQTPPGIEARKRAEEARRGLRQAGFVVPGIEVRPERVSQTEVRYYKFERGAASGKGSGRAAEYGRAGRPAAALEALPKQHCRPPEPVRGLVRRCAAGRQRGSTLNGIAHKAMSRLESRTPGHMPGQGESRLAGRRS